MDPKNRLALLIVDVCDSWETEIKAHERGYFVNYEWFDRPLEVMPLKADARLQIQYPHGSIRAGLDAIVDTARLAHDIGIQTYATENVTAWSCGQEDIAGSLQPYVVKSDRYRKTYPSAFRTDAFVERLKADGCTHLLIIGYDRDCCVLFTAKDAVAAGIKVVTSEHCMLTVNNTGSREGSLAWYREHTTHLESLLDVWNFMLKHGKSNDCWLTFIA